MQKLIRKMAEKEKSGQIDALANLKDDRVYLFVGEKQEDSLLLSGIATRIYHKHGVRIKSEYTIKAG